MQACALACADLVLRARLHIDPRSAGVSNGGKTVSDAEGAKSGRHVRGRNGGTLGAVVCSCAPMQPVVASARSGREDGEAELTVAALVAAR